MSFGGLRLRVLDGSTLPLQTPGTLTVPHPGGAFSVPVATAGGVGLKFDSTMAHRVDCPVAAIYELWAAPDAATTGSGLAGSAVPAGRTLADLADERLAADGTTRIHLRPADPADPTALDRAAALSAGRRRRRRWSGRSGRCGR